MVTWYDRQGFVEVTVTDPGSNKWHPLARFDGSSLKFCRGDKWCFAPELGGLGWEEPRVLCFQVMISTDTYCGNQAACDTEKFGEDARWEEIIEDVRRDYVVMKVIET